MLLCNCAIVVAVCDKCCNDKKEVIDSSQIRAKINIEQTMLQ